MKLEDLKPNQQKAIICLIECSSVSEAARRAQVSESRLWDWLKDSAFQTVLSVEREALFQESMSRIKAGTAKATDTLLALLTSDDERLKRNVANDILDKAFKFKELIDFEERISRLEATCGSKQ